MTIILIISLLILGFMSLIAWILYLEAKFRIFWDSEFAKALAVVGKILSFALIIAFILFLGSL